MCSWTHPIFFFSHILLTLVPLAVSQPKFVFHFCVRTAGNSTAYLKNLETLLPSLSSNVDNYGFYSASIGDNSDRSYAIVLCRGDVEIDVCRSCIDDSTRKLPQLCPNYAEAIGWYDYCMLRYSNRYMKGILSMPETQMFFLGNSANMSGGAGEFNQTRENLLDSLRKEAASGDDRRKFATKIATVPDSGQSIYGLMQCTPDLSEQVCVDCLVKVSVRKDCCAGMMGGRGFGPSCNYRFETYLFYSDTPVVVTPPPVGAPPSSPGKDDKTVVIIVVTSTVAFLVMLIFGILILRKKKQRKSKKRLGSKLKI